MRLLNMREGENAGKNYLMEDGSEVTWEVLVKEICRGNAPYRGELIVYSLGYIEGLNRLSGMPKDLRENLALEITCELVNLLDSGESSKVLKRGGISRFVHQHLGCREGYIKYATMGNEISSGLNLEESGYSFLSETSFSVGSAESFLQEALKKGIITERAYKMLQMRIGSVDGRERTYEEIAKCWCVSPARVGDILKRHLRKLKWAIESGTLAIPTDLSLM